MKIFNYKKLFTIHLTNQFYTDGISEDFAITPTDATKRNLERNKFKFHRIKGGFEVYADAEKSGDKFVPIAEIDKTVKLEFLLKLKNPNFVNFTDLPLKKTPKSAFYFNNINITEKNSNICLSNAEFVNENCLINYCHDYFAADITADKNLAYGELHFPNDRFSILQKRQNTDGKYLYSFLLQNLPSGTFNFLVDKKKQNQRSYYNATNIKTERFFGIIEIYLNDESAGPTRFFNDTNQIEPKDFYIKFKNRSTFWRYIFDNKSEQDLPNPGVIHSDLSYTFNKESNLSFISSDSIPLSNQPVKGIEFRKNKNTASSALKGNLPNPTIDMIRVDEDDNDIIYSDIYVTL